jgi:aryl-alcohol dehydrogenase-like predicted oxidoreductase
VGDIISPGGVSSMKKTLLGNSSLNVSILGLGTINFGTTTSEEDSFKIMDQYVANGGNFIDTANNYAVWNGGNGSESEKTIGKWLQKNNNRSSLIIATKLGALPQNSSNQDFSNMQGLSRTVILESVKKSLHNLKTQYIDLLYLHVDDYNTPQEETLGTLNEMIKEGLIKEIGCSNFRTWRIESARNICLKYNYKFFCAVQQRYSYLNPTIDANFFPQVVADQGLAEYIKWYNDLTLVAYSVLLKGQYNQKGIEKDAYKTNNNELKLNKLLDEESDPNSWVLNYVTKQFGGSVALFTTSKVNHLVSILKSDVWK